MIDVDFRHKANAIQAKCVTVCQEAFGVIGATTFFRCLSCNKLVTANRLVEAGRCWCSGRRYKETNLTVVEELYWVGRAFIWKMKQGLSKLKKG